MERINSKTRLIGLIGKPLAHTFSPLKHNYCFAKLGLNYLYLPIEIERAELKDTITAMKTLRYAGFNITFPYKIDIIDYLDSIDEQARAIGSVNCVKIVDGRLEGYNTDGIAYVSSLKAEVDDDICGLSFLLLGCGGAGRAIAVALAKNGVKGIALYDIDQAKAVSLESALREFTNAECYVVGSNSSELTEAIGESEVLINATALGMHPYEGISPVAAHDIKRGMIVSDITYNPPMTRLLIDAESLGCQCLNGLGMAVYEGVESSRIWTGIEPSASDMQEILDYQVRKLGERTTTLPRAGGHLR